MPGALVLRAPGFGRSITRYVEMERIIRQMPTAGLGEAADSCRPRMASAGTQRELVFAPFISDRRRVLLLAVGSGTQSAGTSIRETAA